MNNHRSFTLTELIVVVGIIVIIMALMIPALEVWESRKFEDAINMSGSILKAAQTAAITEMHTVGLFFYINPNDNAQYIWPIEPEMIPGLEHTSFQRFVLRSSSPLKYSRPIRAVPISLVSQSSRPESSWSPRQIDNNDPTDHTILSPDSTTGTQYHRNLFVMLFDRHGTIVTERRVYIVDADTPDYNPDFPTYPGFSTGLTVRNRHADDPVIQNAIINNLDKMLFQSARGMLIYDDDKLQSVPDSKSIRDARRNYLKREAQPIFVHSVTGSIIKGRQEQ